MKVKEFYYEASMCTGKAIYSSIFDTFEELLYSTTSKNIQDILEEGLDLNYKSDLFAICREALNGA